MRQSDKMHEENIYADEQRGLFKRKVKEQLFHSSILMLTKNKKCRDSAKGPHAAEEAALAAGGLRRRRDPEWEANESRGSRSQNHQPRTCRSYCHQ